jgi:hypothetical protein
MFTVKHFINRTGLAFFAGALALNLSVAHAVAFTSDISISGSTAFDDGFSFGSTSGDFSVVSGGSTTTSTYAGSTATGDNPLAGTLTDLNDGFGFTGMASATDDEFAIGFDTTVNVQNNSLSDVYEVIFSFDYSNWVNSSGDDAFADSELTLDANGIEIAFSDLLSDSFYGNEVAGIATGDSGGALSDSNELFFNFILNPSDILDLDMIWTLEGGDFATGLAEADLSAFLSVVSVQAQGVPVPAPLPGTFLLVGLGLVLLPVQRRMQLFFRG